ncbi:MAG: diguanylate cyclase [Deltaproteobacteria bacterium]|nr:diguanylate cyclase [Deltaproteobacteria bacterium]
MLEKKKILAVDDDEFMLEFLADLLTGEGYQLMTARDGLSALNILKDHTPDVIFIDLIMPGIGGQKLCGIIRGMDRFKDVYIAILSATLADEKIDMTGLGVNALIAKGPFSKMGQQILDVVNFPDLTSSQCRAGAVIGMENISPRGVTRELLKLSRRFETILQGMRDGILEITSGGKVIFANRAFFSILGEAEEKVLGSSLADLFGSHNRQRMRAVLEDLGRKPSGRVEAFNLVAKSRRLEISIMPADDCGNFVVVVSDVTQECEAREARDSSHAQMKELVTKNIDAMLIVNRDGQIIFANPAAEVLFHGGPNGVVGMEFGFPVVLQERTELDLVGPNKEQWVAEMCVAEIAWQGEKSYLASLRDITKRKRMEETLRNANEMILGQQKERIEEERLKVLLQMTGATAHELNQPLTILLGNIELLSMKTDAMPESVSGLLTDIVDSGRRIADIVRKIGAIRRYEVQPYPGGRGIIDFHQKSRFLVVEESEKEYAIIYAILEKEQDIQLTKAGNLTEAFEILEKNEIDLILMDYIVSDGDAFKVMEVLHEKGLSIPVVVITGHGDEMTATRIIQAGISDYLTKESVTRESLLLSVKNALERSRLTKELKMVSERLAEMATTDKLTGLYNRRYALETLEKEMERAKRYHIPLTLCMLDLDHFKNVNDCHGHLAGDAVLTAVGDLLIEHARHTDTTCRYGGEEFLLILTNTGQEGAMTFCERLREEVARQAVKWKETSIGVTISIGVAQYDDTKDPVPESLLERADKALYRAKEKGRNRVVQF